MRQFQVSVDNFYKSHPSLSIIELIIALLIFIGNLLGIIPLTSTIYLFVFAWLVLLLKGKSWKNFGLKKPVSWKKTFLLALLGGVVYQAISLYLIEPFLSKLTGELPDVSAFQSLIGNFSLLLFWLGISWTLAAFGEEFVYRGYFMHRISDIFGGSKSGELIAVALSSVLFGTGHIYQGVSGIISVGLFGLMFATLYYVSGRNLWAPILAHGISDTAGFVIIYIGVYPGL